MTTIDHAWQNWIIDSNQEVEGVHRRINKFIVNENIIATIKAYNGSDYGFLEVHCKEFILKNNSRNDLVENIKRTYHSYDVGAINDKN